MYRIHLAENNRAWVIVKLQWYSKGIVEYLCLLFRGLELSASRVDLDIKIQFLIRTLDNDPSRGEVALMTDLSYRIIHCPPNLPG
jgi:hypothetical protein